jgi:hypothetical protein
MAARAAQSSEFPFSFDATSNRAIQDPRATKSWTHHVLGFQAENLSYLPRASGCFSE